MYPHGSIPPFGTEISWLEAQMAMGTESKNFANTLPEIIVRVPLSFPPAVSDP